MSEDDGFLPTMVTSLLILKIKINKIIAHSNQYEGVQNSLFASRLFCMHLPGLHTVFFSVNLPPQSISSYPLKVI